MHLTKLPYPGILLRGNKLRRSAARNISIVERLVAANGGRPTADMTKLAAFFQACATAVTNIGKPKT